MCSDNWVNLNLLCSDDLRLLVEKSELWVYKAAKPDDKKVKMDPCESISELVFCVTFGLFFLHLS